MPYKKCEDLPDSVRHVLPEYALDIFKEAFNNAIKEHQDPHINGVMIVIQRQLPLK
jgi:cation transport regulator